MAQHPRLAARNLRANLTPAGVAAESAAPQKVPEEAPAAPHLPEPAPPAEPARRRARKDAK